MAKNRLPSHPNRPFSYPESVTRGETTPVPAENVPFAPGGNLSSVNAQAAILELDTEKVAKAGDTMTGALHVGAVIESTSGGFKFPDGTTQLTKAPTTAAEITNTAAGNIAATDVQAALNELDTEKVKKSGDTMTGALTVGGLVESTSGGFKFPDGTTQTSAASAGGSGPAINNDLALIHMLLSAADAKNNFGYTMGSNGTFGAFSGVTDREIQRMQPGTIANDHARRQVGAQTVQLWKAKPRWRGYAYDDGFYGQANSRTFFGMADAMSTVCSGGSDTPTARHALLFRYSPAAGDTNWKALSCGGSGCTVTDTGVAFASSTMFKLEIDFRNTSAAVFKINGTVVATHTTNLPATTFASAFGFGAGIQTTDTNQKSMGTGSHRVEVCVGTEGI